MATYFFTFNYVCDKILAYIKEELYMLLNAVIVKNNVKRIKEIVRTKHFYATDVDKDNMGCEIRFYKNLDAAKLNYPKSINASLEIVIDTNNMQFYAANNVPVLAKPKFAETDSEYIFSFDECVKDLHCVCTIGAVNY